MSQASLFIGLMSGTSLDGIDCVLIRYSETELSLVAALEAPFPDTLRQRLLALTQKPEISLSELGSIDKQLAICYANGVNKLLHKNGIKPDNVTAIGCHGQTVYHKPPSAGVQEQDTFSLQLGDPSTLAKLTGIAVVADFRQADIALGGQGAPLAPAFHRFLFAEQAPIGILNLGGIANLTVLNGGKLIAFDTGPASTLMDAWIRKHKNQHYDKDGEWAATGAVNRALLKQLLAHTYFSQSAPKSTGFEMFNLDWLQSKLNALNEPVSANHVQATLLELTATTVVDQISAYQLKNVYVCGGGIHNPELMKRMRDLSEATLNSTEAIGVPPDWMEAMCFAWLAQRHVAGIAANEPEVTGARAATILGGYFPP